MPPAPSSAYRGRGRPPLGSRGRGVVSSRGGRGYAHTTTTPMSSLLTSPTKIADKASCEEAYRVYEHLVAAQARMNAKVSEARGEGG